ncbi:MAG: tetratricopeptide repeat protein [Candidatus Hatepunaea meridiana]|nr:tetratricopeptide repeat protein [Candidatus Hatepunaea meridiana]
MTSDSEIITKTNLKSGGLPLYIILLGAFIIRIIHLLIVKNTDLVQIPVIDAAFYHQWAVAISQGNVIGDHTFFMSPLFSYFTGLVYAVLGASPVRLMIVQGLIGVVTVLLVYRWGAILAGRMVGLVAAGLTAVYAPFIFFETTLLTSTLILLLSVIILNLTETVLKKDNILFLILLGCVIGLSALTRPMVLIFVPLLALIFVLDNNVTWLKRSALVAAGICIFLIPVGVRNLVVGGEFTLTTSSAGMNFYVGNNPDATGLYWEAPFLSSFEPQFEDEDFRRVASEALGKELTTREAGSYWFNHSLDWILHEPFGYLKLLGKKMFYFWNRAEFANNVSIHLGKELSPVLRFNPFGFWLIAPLGLAGLILFWRRLGWKKARVPVLWTFAYFAGGCLFFIASEYRLPVVLPLLIGAAYLIVEIVRYFKANQAEPALHLIALGLVLMPVSNFRTSFIRSGENARMDWFNIGNTLLKHDHNLEAIERFKQALEIDPYFSEGMMRLAEAYYRAGMRDEAIEIGKRTGLKDPESIINIIQGLALHEAHALLGEGSFNKAMDEFRFAGIDREKAVAETTRISRFNEAKAAIKDNQPNQALKILKDLRSKSDFPDLTVLHNIATIYWRMGAIDSAEHYALEALETDSTSAPTAFLLARILNASGRWEEAQRLTMRYNPEASSLQKKLNNVRAKMDSLTALGKWEQALQAYDSYGMQSFNMHPDDKLRIGRLQLEVGNLELALKLLNESEDGGVVEPELYYYQGRILAALNQDKEAISTVQKGLAIAPEYVPARIFLARLYIGQKKIKEAWNELEAIAHLEIVDVGLAEEYDSLVDSLKGF